MARKTNKAGLDLIKSFEGLYLKPYLCPANIPTIGYGSTYYEDNTKVSLQDPAITEERAVQLLQSHLEEHERYVEKLVKININDNQFSALVSFCYNVGPSSLKKSTLLRLLNDGDIAGAGEQFLRWNKANGKELPGLTRRRQAERSLFLKEMPSNDEEEPTDEEIRKKLQDIEKDIL